MGLYSRPGSYAAQIVGGVAWRLLRPGIAFAQRSLCALLAHKVGQGERTANGLIRTGQGAIGAGFDSAGTPGGRGLALPRSESPLPAIEAPDGQNLTALLRALEGWRRTFMELECLQVARMAVPSVRFQLDRTMGLHGDSIGGD